MKEYFQMESIEVHEQRCDNESVCKRVKSMRSFFGYYPNDTLESDWDVLEEIRQAMNQFDNEFEVKWIKSHQDEKKPWDQLDLAAQTNCKADKLADDFRDRIINEEDAEEDENNETFEENVSIVPRFRYNKAQINISGETITHNLKQVIKVERTYDPLKTKIKEDNNWSEETFYKVDWTVHGRAINRHHTRKTVIVKMLHDILPVGTMVNRYNNINILGCSTCHCEKEDCKHLYICPLRDRWRFSTHFNLRMKMQKLDTDQKLATIALAGLWCFIHNRDFHLANIPVGYEKLIAEQNEIGWDNFMKGRISNEWITKQQQHLQSKELITTRNNGTTWATTIISTIWTDWIKLWEMRNEDRHGKDKTAQAKAERETIIRQVLALYEKACDIHQDDVAIFNIPIEEMAKRETANIFSWMQIWEPLIEMSIEKQKQWQEG